MQKLDIMQSSRFIYTFKHTCLHTAKQYKKRKTLCWVAEYRYEVGGCLRATLTQALFYQKNVYILNKQSWEINALLCHEAKIFSSPRPQPQFTPPDCSSYYKYRNKYKLTWCTLDDVHQQSNCHYHKETLSNHFQLI